MSRINRVPFGLQDLLGSTNFGDNPSELAPVVAPTLDLNLWLASERREATYGNLVAGTSDGVGGQLVVPEGEMWICSLAGITLSTIGTDAKDVWLSLTIQDVRGSDQPTQNHPLGSWRFQSPAGTNASNLGFMVNFGTPFLAFPGENFRANRNAGDYTGTNSYQTRCQVFYTRINI